MIRHRPADLTDRPGNTERKFVYGSWLSSFHKSHSQGLINALDWYSVMIPQLDIITSRPGVITLVAHDADYTDDIAGLFGFICGEPDSDPPFVYYVFTKEAYRRQFGIARGMFKAIGIDPRSRFEYGCATMMQSKLKYKIPLARWNPIGANYDRNMRRSVYE